MPPVIALTSSVSLIGGTDMVNVAALGPTAAPPQGTSQSSPLESPDLHSPQVEPMQPCVSLSPATAPFLNKLVEIKDLLTENVSLLDQLDTP